MPLIDPITMSSAGAASQSAAAKPSLPIELLPTQLSRFISNAHPALLLTTFYMRFPALVAEPTETLLRGLLPLTVLQCVYCVACLPAVGTGTGKGGKKGRTGGKGRSEGSAWNGKAFTIVISLLLTLLSVPALTAIQIVFGAPLTTHLSHTLLSSAHMALLAIFPLMYVHGTDERKWREIASLYAPQDEVLGAAIGAFLGAWCGAVPIPLDWDREWQRWPITVVVGAYVGAVLGRMVSGSGWVRGRRIELS